jgi:phosphoribosyl 1,2-cyclic phosphodiesterase
MADRFRIDFLGSGSSGNATLIRSGDTAVLLDCGFGPRILRQRLDEVGTGPERLDALLITHEHGDHIAGLRSLVRVPGLSIHLTRQTAAALGIRSDEGWDAARVTVEAGRPFRVGALEIEPFVTAHDAGEPVGYVLRLPDGRRLGVATDLGHANRETVTALRGCELLAIEANHDPHMLRRGPYPAFLKRRIRSNRGHLSNSDAAGLLASVATNRLQHLFVLHVSRTNNRPGLVRRTMEARLQKLKLDAEVTVIAQDSVCRYPAPGQQLSLF